MFGVSAGERVFEGLSRVGSNSEGGAASVGGDVVGGGVGGSLAKIYIESRAHVTAKFSPRSKNDLVITHRLLGQGLGGKENG